MLCYVCHRDFLNISAVKQTNFVAIGALRVKIDHTTLQHEHAHVSQTRSG